MSDYVNQEAMFVYLVRGDYARGQRTTRVFPRIGTFASR